MTDLSIKKLTLGTDNFDNELEAMLAWETVSDGNMQSLVAEIIQNVRKKGDEALKEYSEKFDRFSVADMAQLTLTESDIQAAFERLPEEKREALKVSADRVESYHSKQVAESWQYTDDQGVVLGQQVTAMDKVGIYVPGGVAPLASSVIMNAMPAKVAGVRNIVMATPAPDGNVSDFVLGAAHVAGVSEVFLLGGAQAIAALAYGTETVPAVDKIVGPGNAFVATAKAQVFGKVGIDMIAGAQ